jgi:peroxiredoxin
MKYLTGFLLLIALGSYAQDQPLTNVANGQTVSIRDFKGARGVVIIFSSNVCAYDGYYTDRLKSLFAAYGAKVQFVLANSYQEPEEAEDKMKLKYGQWGFDVPYLSDKNQDWMKALGAKKSPEVFVLDADGKVTYSGAIDDNPQLATGVKENYLKRAIDDLLAGKSVGVNTVRAVGCSIRSK